MDASKFRQIFYNKTSVLLAISPQCFKVNLQHKNYLIILKQKNERYQRTRNPGKSSF